MKNIKDYLNEGLLSRKVSTNTPIRYSPKTLEELKDIIIDLLKKGQTNLNCIDVFNITDMKWLFSFANDKITVQDIDISEWNVSNVNSMEGMFAKCKEFNSDISNWNVSKVTDMNCMFSGCKKFNSDLSKWNVSNVTDMDYLFTKCEKFNSDLSNWDVSKVQHMYNMFYGCDTLKKNNKIPAWYNIYL